MLVGNYYKTIRHEIIQLDTCDDTMLHDVSLSLRGIEITWTNGHEIDSKAGRVSDGPDGRPISLKEARNDLFDAMSDLSVEHRLAGFWFAYLEEDDCYDTQYSAGQFIIRHVLNIAVWGIMVSMTNRGQRICDLGYRVVAWVGWAWIVFPGICLSESHGLMKRRSGIAWRFMPRHEKP